MVVSLRLEHEGILVAGACRSSGSQRGGLRLTASARQERVTVTWRTTRRRIARPAYLRPVVDLEMETTQRRLLPGPSQCLRRVVRDGLCGATYVLPGSGVGVSGVGVMVSAGSAGS